MKKGFTLLELLAVIVVLAIIALIVTPFVTKAIENARKGSFKSSMYGLINAAELYCGQELTKNDGVFNGETFTVSNGELVSTTNPNNKLKFKGQNPVGESYVTISDKCNVTLSVTNGTYFASIEPGEIDVTITEEELASREELEQSLAALTARLATVENKNDLQDAAIDEASALKSQITVYANNQNAIAVGKLPWDSVRAQVGNGLTLSNNSILIGSGISQVEVSAKLIAGGITTDASRRLWANLCYQAPETTTCSGVSSMVLYYNASYIDGAIPSFTLPVSEGGTIYLIIRDVYGNAYINFGLSTYTSFLTVKEL